MIIEITDKEFTAIMAAAYTLRNSREAKHAANFVESIHNPNSRRISFYEAVNVLYGLIDRVLEENYDNHN